MYIFDHIQKLILVPMVVTTVTSGCMRGPAAAWRVRPEKTARVPTVSPGGGLSSLVKCLIITLMVHPAPGLCLVSTVSTHLS